MSGSNRERSGAVRLLAEGDRDAANHFGKPLVGWRSTSAGVGGLINPAGWGLLRVVTRKVIEGQMKDLYDQPMIVENAGAFVVCQAGQRVGLVQNFRFTGERLMNAGKDYVRRLDAEGRWADLLETLGEWQWELPRGLSQIEDETDLERFVIATAKAEALEEAGFGIEGARVCGRLNVNPTFFAHAQYVVHGRVVSVGESRPEDLEVIGQTRLFDATQIRAMADGGELKDGMTFAALALVGFRF